MSLPPEREGLALAAAAVAGVAACAVVHLAAEWRAPAWLRRLPLVGAVVGGGAGATPAVAAAAAAADDAPPLPRDKMVGLLKACLAAAEACPAKLKAALAEEAAAAMRYAAMNRQPPPRTPLDKLFTAVYARATDDILRATGVTDDVAAAALEYWSSLKRDREVRALERRIVACSPVEGVTAAHVKAALRATMDCEYALWQAGAAAARAAGLEPGTDAFSAAVRKRVKVLEGDGETYLVEAIKKLGAPWTPDRAAVWPHLLTWYVQHDADVNGAITPATKQQEARVAALGVVGGMVPEGDGGGDDDDGGGAGMEELQHMDPAMLAMLMQGGGGGGGMPPSMDDVDPAMLAALMRGGGGGGGGGGMPPGMAGLPPGAVPIAVTPEMMAALGGDGSGPIMVTPEMLQALAAGGGGGGLTPEMMMALAGGR